MASSSSIPGITSSDITKVTSTSVTKPSTPIKKIQPGIYLLYPEDLPDTIPDTSVSAIDVDNMSNDERITRNRRFFNFIPT